MELLLVGGRLRQHIESCRGWHGIDHGTDRARSHPCHDAPLPEVIHPITPVGTAGPEWAQDARDTRK
jgi:hypothetical protein